MLVVCTCVVHKRCHKDVVNQCPGEKQDPQDVISNEGKVLTWISLYLICFKLTVVVQVFTVRCLGTIIQSFV